MSKQTKMERLEQEAADAKAAMDANLAQGNDLGVEARQLQAKLREGKLSALERIEAMARLKEIDRQLDELRSEGKSLGPKQTQAEFALWNAEHRLSEARRVLGVVHHLGVVKDPPGGLDASPDELERWKQHAEQVVRELAGR